MKTIFADDDRASRSGYFPRVIAGLQPGSVEYRLHHSRLERSDYERENASRQPTLYRINVYPKAKMLV